VSAEPLSGGGMQFEHESLLASARVSQRTIAQQYAYEVKKDQRDAYAGLPLRKSKVEWGFDLDERPRGVKYFPERNYPPEYSVAGTHDGAADDVWAPDRATRFNSTMNTSYHEPARETVVTSPPKYPRREFPFNPTPEEELRHLTVTNERRTDGDRTTEMVTASDWIQRPDANRLVKEHEDKYHRGPPKLPRHSARDHLSDRNREHVLFDPARPDMHTQVNVTRRTHNEGCSYRQRVNALAKDQEADKMRMIGKKQAAQRAASDAAEANELLELRSMGIRGQMARADGRAPPAPPAARSPVATRSMTAAAQQQQPGAASRSVSVHEPVQPPPAVKMPPSSPPGAELVRRPSQSLGGPRMELDDISWVTTQPGPKIAVVNMTKPPPEAVKFPEGAFDFLAPDAQMRLNAAGKRAPLRASG